MISELGPLPVRPCWAEHDKDAKIVASGPTMESDGNLHGRPDEAEPCSTSQRQPWSTIGCATISMPKGIPPVTMFQRA